MPPKYPIDCNTITNKTLNEILKRHAFLVISLLIYPCGYLKIQESVWIVRVRGSCPLNPAEACWL